MAVSSGPVKAAVPKESFARASFTDKSARFRYAVKRQGAELILAFGKTTDSDREQRRLKYFVGSGAAARSYLLSDNGFLYEAPVTYYTASAKWDLSPGYQRYSSPFLTRAIAPGCLKCHASGIRANAGTQNGYSEPPFAEGGVSCERCHGPGGKHVVRMKAGNRSGGLAIVNPARLQPAERADVCAQCHLNGDVRVPRPGKEQADFTPGNRLSAFIVAFVRNGGSNRMKVTSHVENLAQSACQRASGDKLWCGTCHDPHSVPAPQAKAAWYRAKCLTCHAATDCKSHSAVRQANGNDCVACHMPRNPVNDAEHVVYTDHSIPRQPGVAKTTPPLDAPLVLFSGQKAETRDLGLAYAIVALREQNKVYAERAFNLLREAQLKTPDDPQTLSYLADLYKSRSEDANAVRLYERLAQVDPTQLNALVALGAYQMEAGHYEAAIRLWKDALARNPALILVRVNLAVSLLKTGQAKEARTVLEKALEFSPGFPAARDLLKQIR